MADLAGVFKPFKEGEKRPSHWLVNVDCDNVLPAKIVPSLLQNIEESLDTRTGGKVVGFRCCAGNTVPGCPEVSPRQDQIVPRLLSAATTKESEEGSVFLQKAS